jgi:hypothetical protein
VALLVGTFVLLTSLVKTSADWQKKNMALSCVYLAADVYMVCLQHALSTEKEEVMGLLLGEVRIVRSSIW